MILVWGLLLDHLSMFSLALYGCCSASCGPFPGLLHLYTCLGSHMLNTCYTHKHTTHSLQPPFKPFLNNPPDSHDDLRPCEARTGEWWCSTYR
ncbi:hypothetical protein J3F83DRAFT_730587 [Trichoderma novae-zelandiae]